MNPILELIRLEEVHRYGTFGVLKISKEVFCVTLEPPDRLNEAFMSSIPAQQYRCHKIKSPKFGATWRVADVPGRDNILFHPGNFGNHTTGCIILAEHFGKLRGDRAVLNSGQTFKHFINYLSQYTALHLTIKEVY